MILKQIRSPVIEAEITVDEVIAALNFGATYKRLEQNVELAFEASRRGESWDSITDLLTV